MDNKGFTVHEWAKLRQKGRTNLIWLCNEVLNYKDVCERVHGPMARTLQQFKGGRDWLRSQKTINGNPSPGTFKDLIEGYEVACDMWDLEGARERLVLIPRNHLKSSVCTIAHTIQWIINYPNIRILISSGTGGQVEGFIRAIRGHFQANEMFRWLYPEYVPHGKNVKEFGNQTSFTVPCRTIIRPETTIASVSVGAVVAGAHYDVIKHDDMVDKENIRTPEQIQNVKNHFGFLDPLLQRVDRGPGRGWTDVIGTRYDYCLRGDTLVLLSDWTEKPIAEIKVGEEVIGWDDKSRMCPAKVVATSSRKSIILKVTTTSGRSVFCSPTHRWFIFRGFKTANGRKFYGPPLLGRHLISVFTPSPQLSPWQQRDLDWLGGILDGEGYIPAKSARVEIVQSPKQNPEVCAEIERVLASLGIPYSTSKNSKKDALHYNLLGGRSTMKKLLLSRTAKKLRMQKALWRTGRLGMHNGSGNHQIVKIEQLPEDTVYSIQTETGNYIADGYASKNSDLYGTLLDAQRKKEESGQKGDWQILVQSAVVKGDLSDPEHCETLWPERFSAKELLRIADDPTRGWPHLSSQYLMNPRPDSAGLIDSEDQIVWIPTDVMRKIYAYLSLHATVDLAGMESSTNKLADNDFTVITLSGFGRDGTLYILSVLRGRYTPFEVIDLLFKLSAIHPRLMDIKVEKEAHARVLLPFLKREMAKRNKYLPIVEIHRDNRTSKQQRIKGLQPWFRNGSIKFADNQPHKLAIIDEIMRFPKYAHDDILDTIADAMQNREGGVTSDVTPLEKSVGGDMIEWNQKMKIGPDQYQVANFNPDLKQLMDRIWGQEEKQEAMTVDSLTGW